MGLLGLRVRRFYNNLSRNRAYLTRPPFLRYPRIYLGLVPIANSLRRI